MMSTGVIQSTASALSIRIAANFTIDPIEEFLSYWMKMLGITSGIRIAPYNQVFQQLLEGGLLRTERALAKLDEGTYGICDRCGAPIPAGRLRAMPDSVLCVACAATEPRAAPRRR